MKNHIIQPEVIRDYLASQGLSFTAYERFEALMDRKSPDDCWLWKGSLSHGYGQFNGAGLNWPIGAHVTSWILFRGPIPEGMILLHKCPTGHNKRCVNPRHLKLGGKAENGRDSIEQGTNSFCHRKDKWGVKLNQQLADEIRSKWIGYRGQQTELAEFYGVTRHAISLVVRNITWWREGAGPKTSTQT